MATGTATIDFGAWPGSASAEVAVADASVAAGSLVEAWIRPVATADHTADEHWVDPPDVIAAEVVAGVGFTIHGRTRNQRRHHGQYTVAWASL